MMFTKIQRPLTYGLAIAGFAVSTACASTQPSVELTEARRVYDEAEKSHAPELAPDKMLDARQLMVKAEKAHDDDPGSDEEKQFSYLANRRAKIAMAHGEILDAERDQTAAKDAYVETQSEIITATKKANVQLRDEREATTRRLTQTETELSDINHELANKQNMHQSKVAELEARAAELTDAKNELETTQASLETSLAAERDARLDAEQRARDALTSLEAIAMVKAEQNETIITLSGSVVFESGTAKLLGVAKEKLTEVAKALSAQSDSTRIVVEGHTDSKGGTAFNQNLSKQRADTVRTFLVSQGVKDDRIVAVGRGEAEPVANNGTAEGRANNRRVEIVLSNAKS